MPEVLKAPVVPVTTVTHYGNPVTTETHYGNAVYIGYGYFLTAHHVLQDADDAALEISASEPLLMGKPSHEEILHPHDLCVLELKSPLPNIPFEPAPLSRMDRWETLTVKGWLPNDPSPQYFEFPGKVRGRSIPAPGARPLWELHLETPAGGSVQGLSGSGLFDEADRLVGILSQERSDAEGKILYFVALDEWPTLWPDGVQIGSWREDVPRPWRDGRNRLAVHKPPFGRETVIAALEGALHNPGRESGYVVLLGSPRRGKSAIMAELIRRAGPATCPWLFAVRGQSTLLNAEAALIEQIDYLLDYEENKVPRAQVNAPGAALGKSLSEWARTDRPHILFLDALDELEGAERLPFLPRSLPRGVFVVASLRHEPRRRAELTRYRPCLGVIDLDEELLDDLDPGLHLSHRDEVRRSNEAAIEEIWREWEASDTTPSLPPGLRSAIGKRLGSNVGAHAAYADTLRGRVTKDLPLPAPGEVPTDPEQINAQSWDLLMRTESAKRYMVPLGLIAAARTPLRKEVLQNLAGWDNADAVDVFLEDARGLLKSSGGEIFAHHISWNDLVREKLAGQSLADCHQRLAWGTEKWPMKDLDRHYWLRYRPTHLMSIAQEAKVAPATRDAAWKEWTEQMSDPVFLADRGALDGVDSLLADLQEGIHRINHIEELEQEEWYRAWQILLREAGFLREVAQYAT